MGFFCPLMANKYFKKFKFIERNKLLVLALLFISLFSVSLRIFAAALYTPGQTLDPSCTAGSTDCTVGLFPDQTSNSGKYLTTDGSTMSWATVTGMGIGNAITSATAGSILFAGASGVLAQDNSNFFWDDTNNRLGIGTTTPSGMLSVGSHSEFQVDSTGAITTTGITSSGSITFSGFSTNGGLLYTNASGVLAQTGAGTSTTILHGGTSPSYSAVSLTADVSGTLPVGNGGTGIASGTAGGVLAFNGATTTIASSLAGTTGQALISGGTATPTWYAPTAGSVLFAGTSGILQQDNSSLYFDDTNNRLGIGTTSPKARLDAKGVAQATGTGTVSTTIGGNTLTGSGTVFTSELSVGDRIATNGSQYRTVVAIASNTSLTVDKFWTATESGVVFYYTTKQISGQNSSGTVNFAVNDYTTLIKGTGSAVTDSLFSVINTSGTSVMRVMNTDYASALTNPGLELGNDNVGGSGVMEMEKLIYGDCCLSNGAGITFVHRQSGADAHKFRISGQIISGAYASQRADLMLSHSGDVTTMDPYIRMNVGTTGVQSIQNFFKTSIATSETVPTAFLDLGASTTSNASLRIRSGTAPTSPNEGDVWYDGTDLVFRDGSASKGIVFMSGTQTIAGAKTFTTAPTSSIAGIAATSTDGYLLTNTTAATSGTQQYSPRLRWRGNGFATSGSSSQTHDYIVELRPVQGTNSTANLDFSYSFNGAAYGKAFTITETSGGDSSISTYSGGTSYLTVGPTSIVSSSNGFNLTVGSGNLAATSGTNARITWGGTWATDDRFPGLFHKFGADSQATAIIDLAAGSASASHAPLKFTSGTNLTTPEAGAVEYDGTQLYFSPSTTRNMLAQISGSTALTAGSVAFVGSTGGYLTQDNASLFFDDTNNRLGILDATPTAALTVGSGDLFQVNSSGAIAAATAITSSGTITFSGLSTAGLVTNTSGGVLGTTSVSSGISGALSDETGSGALVFGTSPTFTTKLTSPIILGGTGTTSTLTLQTTSGVGTTNADMIFKVGNNGATEAMRILNSGSVGIGTSSPGSSYLTLGRGLSTTSSLHFNVTGVAPTTPALGDLWYTTRELFLDGDITLNSKDLGANAGPIFSTGYNNNGSGTPAAGSVDFVNNLGTHGYAWQDAAGTLEIGTAAPTNAGDMSGVPIGAFASTRDTKQDIVDYTDYGSALQMVLDAPLHYFRYKKEVAGYGSENPLAKVRLGYIADEVDPLFMWHGVIDQVSVNGILLASVKALDLKVEPLSSLDLTKDGSLANLVKTFLADTANSIDVLFAKHIHTDELCIGQTCVTEAQLQQLLNQQNSGGSGGGSTPPPPPETPQNPPQGEEGGNGGENPPTPPEGGGGEIPPGEGGTL